MCGPRGGGHRLRRFTRMPALPAAPVRCAATAREVHQRYRSIPAMLDAHPLDDLDGNRLRRYTLDVLKEPAGSARPERRLRPTASSYPHAEGPVRMSRAGRRRSGLPDVRWHARVCRRS